MIKKGFTAGRPSAVSDRAVTLASLAEDAQTKRVQVELTPDLHAKLKIYAARQGKSIKELLAEYIKQLPE